MPKIIVAISNGFEEIETISIIDICRRANIDVTIASAENIAIVGAHNITIIADTMIDTIHPNEFDMIVLPGGLPNAYTLADNKKVQELLQVMKKNKKYIGAICAAPFALHTAGVLNQNYTCYPSFEKKIRENGYDKNKNVVVDGKVITSRGPGTAMSFALEIVNTLCGKERYEEVKKALLFN